MIISQNLCIYFLSKFNRYQYIHDILNSFQIFYEYARKNVSTFQKMDIILILPTNIRKFSSVPFNFFCFFRKNKKLVLVFLSKKAMLLWWLRWNQKVGLTFMSEPTKRSVGLFDLAGLGIEWSVISHSKASLTQNIPQRTRYWLPIFQD